MGGSITSCRRGCNNPFPKMSAMFSAGVAALAVSSISLSGCGKGGPCGDVDCAALFGGLQSSPTADQTAAIKACFDDGDNHKPAYDHFCDECTEDKCKTVDPAVIQVPAACTPGAIFCSQPAGFDPPTCTSACVPAVAAAAANPVGCTVACVPGVTVPACTPACTIAIVASAADPADCGTVACSVTAAGPSGCTTSVEADECTVQPQDAGTTCIKLRSEGPACPALLSLAAHNATSITV